MLDPDQPVDVYRNLNKGGWSIRQGGRVQDWRPDVTLTRVTFKVRPGGRDKVRQGGHKQVHAWATGYLSAQRLPTPQPARYNPLDCDTFVLRDTGAALHAADCAYFDSGGQLHIGHLLSSSRPLWLRSLPGAGGGCV